MNGSRPQRVSAIFAGRRERGIRDRASGGSPGRRGIGWLPLSIRNSNYFANVVRRVAAGDTPRKAVSRLDEYLDGNEKQVWDNSWVRFPRRVLGAYAAAVLDQDLRAVRSDPLAPYRSDAHKFLFHGNGEEYVRIPISYLVKLALADALYAGGKPWRPVRSTGVRLLSCGREIAKETAKRYLFTQLLVAYANERFDLRRNGQEALIFSSPHPPIRQKRLNDCISDTFYRELFMSPCLSDWDNGKAKHDYMALCHHQVLSRSHLNAVEKLREVGIITRNLVVLPNTSNIGLANNGVHVTLSSRILSRALLSTPSTGRTSACQA